MKKSPNKATFFTRGSQITFNNWRMLWQVNQRILHWCILLLLALTIASLYVTTSLDTLRAAYYYIASMVLQKVGLAQHVFHINWHETTLRINTFGVLSEPYFTNQLHLFWYHLKLSFYYALSMTTVVTIGLTFWLIKRGKQQAESDFVRGSRLHKVNVVAKMVKSHGAADIVIGSLPMAKDFEVRHTLIHGTTGSGKGQTFNQFIEQIRRRGDSAIIFDKGCVFTSLFYQEQTDTLLNPFDKRCAPWDLWQEATTAPDFDNMAEALIPMHGESDPYWVTAARTVFAAAAYRMQGDKNRSIEKLLSLLLTAKLDNLGHYLQGTEAATLVSDKIEKTAISIRSVLSTSLKSLRFLQGLSGKTPFSIHQWIAQAGDSKESRFLLISSHAKAHVTLRPLISMWLSIASIALLSLEEDYDRRLWFICDELPSLHQLPQLAETIAEVRKFGGCFILGMQSFAQLQKIYGSAAATEIFDLLNTRFFFRSPSADMATLVSKELGHEEIEQHQESYAYGVNTIRDGITIGTQRATRPLVTAAEIMALPDLTAYVRVPLPVAITKITLTYQQRPILQPGFIACRKTAEKTKMINQTKVTLPQKNESNSNEVADTNQLTPDDLLPNNTRNPLACLQQQEDNILTLDKHSNHQDERESP